MAVLRVSVALVVYLSGQVEPTGNSPIPEWAYAIISFSFGIVGAMLVVGNRSDVRASWLGGVLLLLASPLTASLIPAAYAPVGPLIGRVRPEAFLPVFCWRFLMEFPSALAGSRRRVAAAVSAAGVLFGTVAAAVNLSFYVWPVTELYAWRALFAARSGLGSMYWPMVFLPSAAAFVGLVVRMTTSSGPDLFRARVFVGGLAAGLLPVFVEVTVEETWPWFKNFVHQPSVEPWVGFSLFAPLATVPLLTAYSVVYDRIVEMRVVLRAALQYLLARVSIIGLTSLPFVALTLYLIQHRAEPLVILLAGPRPLALVGAVLAGIVTLKARRRWLHVLDRRFFREQYDSHLLLTQLTDEIISKSPAEIAARLSSEIEQALHAQADLFVADDTRGLLADPLERRPPIAVAATLVSLAMADTRPMDLDLDPGSALARLPDVERVWIDAGGYRLIIPLRTRSGEPAGLVALGQKRSELPFSDSDRRSLATLTTTIALALENERLRHTPDPTTEPPARECLACSRLHPPDAAACSCGGALREGSAPHTLRGVFRLDRRIGAGGMGVVYHAMDLSLGREVAIKTLPRVTPAHVSRLQREAMAMASLVDANLAVIYGIETWRGIPFLVEEYLSGGTLADRLLGGPLAISDALDIGVTLASALGRLHAAGIVHCDIKPSNIGFSRNGVVKLLDFGLVHLLRATGCDVTSALTTTDPPTASLVVTNRGVMGTPPYMSPEALHAEQPAPSFDRWALSVVLYEAIAGRRPFVGADAREVGERICQGVFPGLHTLRKDCSDELTLFFARALATDASLRPDSAESLASQIESLRR